MWLCFRRGLVCVVVAAARLPLRLRLGVERDVRHLLARVEERVLRRLGQDVLRGADDDGEHERRRAERGDQREERLVEEDEAEEDA